MNDIIDDENERIENEKLRQAEIEGNHGKNVGYFAVPSFMKDKNSKLNKLGS